MDYWRLTLTSMLIILSCVVFIDASLVVCFRGVFGDNDASPGEVAGEDLCTHVIYLYGHLKSDTYELNYVSYVTAKPFKKTKIPQPIRMISVGSTANQADRNKISQLESSDANIEAFVRSAVTFLLKYNFGGLHLNWILTNVQLADKIFQAFKPYGYLLSTLGSANHNDIDDLPYDARQLDGTVDFLILWTIDLHDPISNPKLADHHALLRLRMWDDKHNVSCADCAVKRWIEKGFTRDKLVLSIPLFGQAWTLPSKMGPTNPPVKADGPFSFWFKGFEFAGMVPYHEICNIEKSWIVYKDADEEMGPYAIRETNPRIWVGYDDPSMAEIKSNYILSEGLGGAAVFDLVMEDTDDVCGGGINPMLTAISRTLKSDSATIKLTSVMELLTFALFIVYII